MDAQIEALQQDIIQQAVKESAIGSLLQKAKVLAILLRDGSFREWADAEIQGYAGRELALPDYRNCGCGIHARFASMVMRGSQVFDPTQIEDAVGWERGSLSKKPIAISASAIESHKASGKSLDFVMPGVDLRWLVSQILAPGVHCLSANFTISNTDLESVLAAVRSRVLDYAVAATENHAGIAQAAAAQRPPPQDPSSSSNVSIQIGAMTQKSTTFSPSNSAVSNVNIDSKVSASSMVAGAQTVSKEVQPQDPLSSDDALLFRQEVKDVLHLLVDRYEDIDAKLQRAMQDALTQAQRLNVEGKTLKEVEDMVGDLWAKSQVDAMQHHLPQDILEAISGKSWVSFLAKFIRGPAVDSET